MFELPELQPILSKLQPIQPRLIKMDTVASGADSKYLVQTPDVVKNPKHVRLLYVRHNDDGTSSAEFYITRPYAKTTSEKDAPAIYRKRQAGIVKLFEDVGLRVKQSPEASEVRTVTVNGASLSQALAALDIPPITIAAAEERLKMPREPKIRRQNVKEYGITPAEASLLFEAAADADAIGEHEVIKLPGQALADLLGDAWEDKLGKLIIGRKGEDIEIDGKWLQKIALAPVGKNEVSRLLSTHFRGAKRAVNAMEDIMENPEQEQVVVFSERTLNEVLGLAWRDRLKHDDLKDTKLPYTADPFDKENPEKDLKVRMEIKPLHEFAGGSLRAYMQRLADGRADHRYGAGR